MKEHRIEYTDHGILAKTGVFVGVCLLVVVLLAVLPVANEVALVSGFVAAISISLVHLSIASSGIRKTGIILIGYNRMVFGMVGRTEVVDLLELDGYRIVRCDGTRLTLVLKNGNKFKITASNNFCDASKLDRACRDIETLIRKYSKRNTLTPDQNGPKPTNHYP